MTHYLEPGLPFNMDIPGDDLEIAPPPPASAAMVGHEIRLALKIVGIVGAVCLFAVLVS